MPSPEIQDLARALPRDAFTKVYGDPFLVVTDTGDDEPPSSFETVDASAAPRSSGVVQRGVEIHPIAKKKGNPYPERIVIGRATNCDIVLRYASVSKTHAYFARSPDGGLELVDIGSQSGTRVNGRTLTANKPVPVALGAILILGRVAARFAGAAAVWDLLKAQERLNSA